MQGCCAILLGVTHTHTQIMRNRGRGGWNGPVSELLAPGGPGEIDLCLIAPCHQVL